jgi:hypothetical protein
MIELLKRIRALKPATKWAIILGMGLVAVGIVSSLNPVPQPQSYHNFADKRSILDVPNGMDVLSNLPFMVAGLWGLCLVVMRRAALDRRELWAYFTLFVGLVLTGLGSSYYHLAPDNQRLVFDRLPMTVAMAGFISVLLIDRFGPKTIWALPVAAATGLGSVLQWALSEQHGHGDLRWYALYQGMIMLFAAALLLLFWSRTSSSGAFAIAAIANLAAKLFEVMDGQIYQMGGIVSGHTLKHLSASLGFLPLVFLIRRK